MAEHTMLVQFRLIHMDCCGHQFCNVNPRFFNFCPNCGDRIFPDVRKWVMQFDPEAKLIVDLERG